MYNFMKTINDTIQKLLKTIGVLIGTVYDEGQIKREQAGYMGLIFSKMERADYHTNTQQYREKMLHKINLN